MLFVFLTSKQVTMSFFNNSVYFSAIGGVLNFQPFPLEVHVPKPVKVMLGTELLFLSESKVLGCLLLTI